MEGFQKFRIPFKNLGGQEIEVEFAFQKQSQAVNSHALSRIDSSGIANSTSQSPIDWTITPATLKIPANSVTTMLNVSAKLKNSYTIKKSPPLKKTNSEKSEEEGSLELSAPQLQRSNTMEVKKQQSKTEKYNHLLIGKIKDT